jgi:hypothetical protein
MDMGHSFLLLRRLPAGFTDPIKTQLMAGHLITGCFHQFLGPAGDITELKLNDLPADFADDVMVVILHFAELIFTVRPWNDFEGHPEGLEKIEGSINGSETDLPFLPLKAMIEVLRAHRAEGFRQFLIDQEPWEAEPEAVLFEYGS